MDKSHKWQKQPLAKAFRKLVSVRLASSKQARSASVSGFHEVACHGLAKQPLGGEQGGHFCPGKPAAAPSRSGLNSYTAQTTFELIGERFMHDSLKADMASLTMKGVKWSKVEGARWGFDY